MTQYVNDAVMDDIRSWIDLDRTDIHLVLEVLRRRAGHFLVQDAQRDTVRAVIRILWTDGRYEATYGLMPWARYPDLATLEAALDSEWERTGGDLHQSYFVEWTTPDDVQEAPPDAPEPAPWRQPPANDG